MKLSPMRYKDYVWPHNPRVYSISYVRRVGTMKVPFGRYHMQDLGMDYRILKGEGEFFGPGAYDEFKKLATVFYDNGPGLLIHPVWQSSKAYFVKLQLNQEPISDYVSYSFEFWEDYSSYEKGMTELRAAQTAVNAAQSAAEYYTVRSGDTLWGIAASFGMELEALLKLNPQIKNPNLIFPGDEVRVG